MNSILESLYMCSTEDGAYLTHKELRDYHNNLQLKEGLEEKFKQLLGGEMLELFKKYIKANDDVMLFGDSSSFRSGLVIGLKLGMFCSLDH